MGWLSRHKQRFRKDVIDLAYKLVQGWLWITRVALLQTLRRSLNLIMGPVKLPNTIPGKGRGNDVTNTQQQQGSSIVVRRLSTPG